MRRKDKEITNQQIIEQILTGSDICRIALHDTDYPYIVPLNYGYYEGALYFHCAPQGRKIDLIRRNNNVSFEIEYAQEIVKHETSCKWTTKYRSVMGCGSIEIIDHPQQKVKGLEAIMAHYGRTDNKFDVSHVQNLLVLKLTIRSVSGKQSGDW